MVISNAVVVTSVVGVALVTMLMVREWHGVVHAVRTVRSAVGGEREGNGLGTETLWSLCMRNDTAPKLGLSTRLHVVR